MQIEVIKKSVKEKGPQFAGKLLNVTYLVKVWPNMAAKSTTPVVEKEIVTEYNRTHESDPDSMDRQDVRINKELEDAAVATVNAYLNEKALLETEERVDAHVTTLQAELDKLYKDV